MSSGAEEPASPGITPVRLSDCAEELVRFTLADSGEELGLSRDYCSRLLQDDPLTARHHLNDAGVPTYPLYKHLAKAIERCVNSGTFQRAADMPMQQDEVLQEKESVWNKLIADIGMELSNMLEAVDFELHVQEPYFSQLRDGRKIVEGRCAIGNYNRIAPGALLLFNKCLLLKVQHVMRYNTFLEMLLMENMANVLPGIETIEEGVEVYHKFYTKEKEMSNGVVAISVSKVDSQPYISMANLLSGLNYDGIGHLLRMMHTAGTVVEALPPPRSSLISSSKELNRPNVQGCLLTTAARSLTKHVARSSDGWWGTLVGNDTEKNNLASEAINNLLDDCCWMNIHLIQPYECVFEIRVCEGYGARWTKDGSKFIGFLEPYTEEGYSKGWKH